MLTLQPRHRLDIRLRHFAYALIAAAWARNPEDLSVRLEVRSLVGLVEPAGGAEPELRLARCPRRVIQS
jgi:hypothetical protein